MKLDYQAHGKNGQSRLTVRFPDGTSFTDKIDLARATDRKKFVAAVAKGRNGMDKKALAAELENVAAAIVAKPQNDEEEGQEKKKQSQAEVLVLLAAGAELFHTPGGHDSEGFATFEVNGHLETWPIGSKGFRRWLLKQYFDKTKKIPSSEALQDAINTLAGKAIYDGQEKEIAVRVAQTPELIWLDLADESWQAVRITADGWQLVAKSPVKFIRKRGMLPLPVPVAGGKIDLLRDLANLPDDDGWRLFVIWLVAAIRPGLPFPILVVNGEQGSAKTTLCKMAKALIDPNKAALRRPPREDRDLMIAATNGWIVAYDNLSEISPRLSDALCMLATGGGFGTRELYTDDDEKLFDATRPVIVNGIDDLASRGDFLDRSIRLTLPAIDDDKRRDEEELWTKFYELRPKILGALLDAVATAMKNRPTVKLTEKPRMADFALWGIAAEPALGWPEGAFLAAYNHNRSGANSLALESSIIAPCIIALVGDQKGPWNGIAKDLLEELEKTYADEKTRKHKDWPTSPRKLSGELRRLAPNLRREGIDVEFGRHGKRGTPITIGRTGKTSSPPSPSSPAHKNKEFLDDGWDSMADKPSPTATNRHIPSPETPEKPLENGHGDDGDGLLQTQSVPPESDEVMEWTA